MDKIKSLLSRIEKLSDTELDELRQLILAEFSKAKADPDQVVTTDELSLLASASTAYKSESNRRVFDIEERAGAMQTLREFSSARNFIPADRLARGIRTGGGSVTALTASGHEIFDRSAVAGEFISALRFAENSNAAPGERTPVVRLKANRPDSLTLRSSDSAESITASIGDAAEEHTNRSVQTITAAGGPGAMPDSDYALPGFESTERPVKNALPVFTTDRAGVRFMRPPSLADVNGAVGLWTVQNDIDALTNAGVRKPSLRVLPGAEIKVDVQAVTSILTFGNMLGRAYPEHVARVVDLALAVHSRVAEQQLLTQLGSLSTSVSGSSNDVAGLGATRVLLSLYDRAATSMRNRLRMPSDAPLQLIMPDWARGILRSDLARQEPGDSTLGVTDAELAEYLSTRHLAPTWAMDGEAGQQFNPQAPGPVNDWPTRVISYMFPAGSFQFLDGGTLDLGIVRDSELNSRNDHQMFSETFEGLLFRGGESFRISQPVTASGVARASANA